MVLHATDSLSLGGSSLSNNKCEIFYLARSSSTNEETDCDAPQHYLRMGKVIRL